ncbi:AAA family ATPase [Rhodospirillum sp. A1_3_36]|uniref:bifunctional aminoglycoside phosphotransferase/ATP-binding protein n=1 Tax=Rhodospirillum sp. A1_3_36 TaxID=3391666 RepID=UPI0039A48330
MTPDSQRDVYAFLSTGKAHGHPGKRVEQIHTHVSALFLCGDRVLKLKRAVALPYLDHTTLAARKACCAREVEINGPTAPGLYLGVLPITREADGSLAVDGKGEPVDYAVAMRRFKQGSLFDRMLSRGQLDRHQMCDLAESVMASHNSAPVIEGDDGRNFVAIVDNSLASLAENADILGREQADAVEQAIRTALEQAKPALAKRAAEGKVRRCHGDLHLRNILLWDGKPTLFDAIDFNDLFVTIDVLYDLAFLLMDLDYRGQRRLAAITFNHYMEYAGDTQGLSVLPLFLAMRAMIRAFVHATAASGQSDPSDAAREIEEGKAYLALSLAYLSPPAPRMAAVGGLSGSGKSRLARELACHFGAAPGALVLRTDVLRKRIMGKQPYEKLGPEGYTPEIHAKVYATLKDEAKAALAAGHSVILDGVHARQQEREQAEALAAEAGVPFTGLWVHTPVEVAMKRIETRVRNPSDVTLEIRAEQENFDLGAVTWHRVDSSGPKKETLVQGLAALGLANT